MLDRTKQKLKDKVYEPVAKVGTLAVLAVVIAFLALIVGISRSGN